MVAERRICFEFAVFWSYCGNCYLNIMYIIGLAMKY